MKDDELEKLEERLQETTKNLKESEEALDEAKR